MSLRSVWGAVVVGVSWVLGNGQSDRGVGSYAGTHCFICSNPKSYLEFLVQITWDSEHVRGHVNKEDLLRVERGYWSHNFWWRSPVLSNSHLIWKTKIWLHERNRSGRCSRRSRFSVPVPNRNSSMFPRHRSAQEFVLSFPSSWESFLTILSEFAFVTKYQRPRKIIIPLLTQEDSWHNPERQFNNQQFLVLSKFFIL